MRNKNLFLILFLAVLMLMVSMVSVSAQNVDNMSNEELTTLLLQIMQKLEQSDEEAETPEPTPTPTPVPTEIPQPELSDDNAELEALLMAIMQKLQQEENTGTASEKPGGTPVPVSFPEEEENSIWDNKKLIIEGLPSYMFIQPTQAPKPEKHTPGGGGNPGGGNPSVTPEPTPFDKEWDDDNGVPGRCPRGMYWYCNDYGSCFCASHNG